MADAKTEEYYQRVLNLIDANEVLVSTDAIVKNCERIARLCDTLGSFKDCSELKDKYENLAKDVKEKNLETEYSKCLTRMNNANSIDSLKRTEMLFRELGDYKDASVLADSCKEKITGIRRREIIGRIIRSIAAIAAVVLLVHFMAS